MKDAKQLMIEDMKLRGLAPRTQDSYLHAIKALTEHYHRQSGKITEKQVRKYLLYLIESNRYAKTTFNIDLCAIKFLYRRTLGREWNLLHLKCTKTNKKLPIILSRDEMWSLLDLVRRPKPLMCLTLMYTFGLRVSEGVNLRLDDIDGKRMVVRARNTKGCRDRSVSLPIQILTQLRLYWLKYRPKIWLLTSNKGTKPITTNCVQCCLKATLRQSNIHKNVGCHTLRHKSAHP
ncbi:tyrosine-type recombinase/integrase [Planctomycetota bacterium]